MSLLPENTPKQFVKSPRIFFVWGGSMSGKTYLARQFPNPILINTDGNAKKVSTPSVEIKDFETFVKVLGELEQGKHTFQTIIIDLIDDIKSMMEAYICRKACTDKATYETIGDIPFGKGHSESKALWTTLMMRLSQMNYNLVFVSHLLEMTDPSDDAKKIQVPSLDLKYLNVTKGRCDAYVKCVKIGNSYIQSCEEKRDVYSLSDVVDVDLRKSLSTIKKLFSDEVSPLTKTEVKYNADGEAERTVSPLTETTPRKPMLTRKEEK